MSRGLGSKRMETRPSAVPDTRPSASERTLPVQHEMLRHCPSRSDRARPATGVRAKRSSGGRSWVASLIPSASNSSTSIPCGGPSTDRTGRSSNAAVPAPRWHWKWRPTWAPPRPLVRSRSGDCRAPAARMTALRALTSRRPPCGSRTTTPVARPPAATIRVARWRSSSMAPARIARGMYEASIESLPPDGHPCRHRPLA